MYKCKRRHVTLIEMMIVMFLIAMIIGVVAYNYQGSLEEGKAFKTKTNKQKIENALTLILSDYPEYKDDIETKWKDLLTLSPLLQNTKDMENDGWGKEFEVKIENDRVEVKSSKLQEYHNKAKASVTK